MSSIIKVNTYQDANGNALFSSDGSGTVTLDSNFSGVLPSNTPAFMARRSSTQAMANGVDTKVIFDSEISDTDSAYDTSTGRFTVPSGKGGKYYIHSKLRWAETDDWDSCELYVFVNGSALSYMSSWWVQRNNSTQSSSGILTLNAGDYVEIYCYQGSGSSRNISNHCVFNGFRLIGA